MFVRIKVETNYCGEWDEGVFEFPDSYTQKELEDYAQELADENALTFGETLDEDDWQEDGFREAYYDYTVLNMTREEVLEEYGEIQEA